MGDVISYILLYEVSMLKEDEKKPNTWETVDPKPPIVHSGHLENRTRN